MQRHLIQVTILLAAILGGCASTPGHLRILHTTDVHGHFADGLTNVASYADAARTQGPAVLLVDSGDMWSGTLMSDRTEGTLGIAAFNAMGYDAAAIGNHEFDYGPVGPDRTGGEDPFGALAAALKDARFPLLSANLIDKKTGKPPKWPNLRASMLVRRGGFLVGIVGATTVETPSITFPHVGEALAFTDATAAVVREATSLRDQGADVVVLIAHIGGICTSMDNPNDLSSCDTDSELFTLVRALPPGLVDVALGGHTHRPMAHWINGVLVAHTGANATHVMDVVVEGVAGDLAIRSGPPRRARVEGDTVGPTRSALDAVLGPAVATQEAQRTEKLGARVVADMGRDRVESSPVGSFLCDVLLNLYPEREVCLLNSGGIRQDIPAGDLTYGHLYDVLPFGNYAATIDLSGAALLDLIRLGTSGAHGVIQVAGLGITYDRSIAPCTDGSRERLVSVTGPRGAPIDPARTYRVVTSSFLAAGGDGWREVITSLPTGSVRVLDHTLPLREQIGAWLRDKRPILNSPDNPVMPTKRVTTVAPKPSTSGGRCVQ